MMKIDDCFIRSRWSLLFGCMWILWNCHQKNIDTTSPTTLKAPFSTDTVQTKLVKVFYNDKLFEEYLYKEGYVYEVKSFLLTNGLDYASTVYKRGSNGINIVESYRADFDTESGAILNQKTLINTLVFNNKVNGTNTLTAQLKDANSTQLMAYSYLFDSQGYLSEVQQKNGYVSNQFFLRNDRQNVVEISNQTTSGETTKSTYKYDSNKNPYYSLNLIGTTPKVFSPNNITQETSTGIHVGDNYTVNYVYKYRSDGYPTEVTVSRGDGSVPYVLRFIYDR